MKKKKREKERTKGNKQNERERREKERDVTSKVHNNKWLWVVNNPTSKEGKRHVTRREFAR